MRVAFLGTPDFALPSLEMLIRAGHTLSVFTQPDKPVGRRAGHGQNLPGEQDGIWHGNASFRVFSQITSYHNQRPMSSLKNLIINYFVGGVSVL